MKKIIILCLILTGCGSTQKGWNAEFVQQCLAQTQRGAGDVQPAPPTVVVMSGQSNMLGFGKSSELPASLRGPVQNVVIWVNDHWETYKPGPTCFGPDVSFAAKWSADHPGERIGIIKFAVGSTHMGRWQPGGDLNLALLNKYRESGALPVLGFYWVQGESDSNNREYSALYQQRLESMIVDIRNKIGFSPFVFARTATTGFAYWETISAAQTYIASFYNQSSVYLVETLDLSTYEGVHFNTESQIELGTRLYTMGRQ